VQLSAARAAPRCVHKQTRRESAAAHVSLDKAGMSAHAAHIRVVRAIKCPVREEVRDVVLAAVARHRRQLELHATKLEGLRRSRHCQCPAQCTLSQSGRRSDVLGGTPARGQRGVPATREACAGLTSTVGRETLWCDKQASPADAHVRTSGMSQGCARSSSGSSASARGGAPARRRLPASEQPGT